MAACTAVVPCVFRMAFLKDILSDECVFFLVDCRRGGGFMSMWKEFNLPREVLLFPMTLHTSNGKEAFVEF